VTLPPLLAISRGIRARPRKAKAPRDRNAEARIQAAIVEWIRTVAPHLICFHPANGGYRTKAEAARLKWVGVLAGIPDVVILGPDGRAWLIEVKAERGAMSAEQRAIRERCVGLRIPFATARSIDEVRWAFEAWGIKSRESHA
jgi:VRR-NUC domain